jgi:glycosyltransferase involved in cell wall biosynthesis
MKVVIAALSAPPHLNGVSRHAIGLARALLSSRAVTKVHFLAGAWQKAMFQVAFDSMDARFHPHWMPLQDANFSRLFWYFHELPHIASQLEADVVHLTFPAPIAAHAFRCPVALTLHDLYPFEIPENFGLCKSALARWTVRQCIRRVDAITCVSMSTRAQLERWFPAAVGKTTIVPNVVDPIPVKETECRCEMLDEQSFILCVAQHRPNKNVPLAIRIFERLVQDEVLPPRARLLVVGIPGPETKKIQAQILDARLSGRVYLSSGLQDAELQWCYRNCAVLLAPSQTEGFGLPVAEGMLAGCRIVCSDIPAFREIGGDGCRFVAWEGSLVDSYAATIREVLTLPRPPARELTQLSSVSVGRRYLDVYENLFCSPTSGFDKLSQPERVHENVNPLDSRST